MRIHHVLALAGCVGLSTIALNDAVTHGLTGQYTVFNDESGRTVPLLLSDLVHGLTYAALCLVLVREAGRFADTNRVARVARVARRVLLVSLALLALGFVVASPVMLLWTGEPTGVGAVVWGVIGTGALLAMVLAGIVLGLALARRNPLGLGGRVLLALLPVIVATIGLGLVAPDWAHPGYTEMVINVGVALLGVRAAAYAGSSAAASRQLVST